MQVDPMKPTLTPPGTKRLNLKCDEPLSSLGFKFNWRRYTEGGQLEVLRWARQQNCPWTIATCAVAARYGGAG